MKPETILYIATSLDGFIARKNGSVDWLSKYMSKEEDYGYNNFFNSITTVLMGNNTYKQVLGFGEFPYKSKNCFVFSKKKKKDKNVNFVDCSVKEFLKIVPEKNSKMWICGGANLINQFLKNEQVNKIIIHIIPIILGDGIKLFKNNNPEKSLSLEEIKKYKSGVVEVRYFIK